MTEPSDFVVKRRRSGSLATRIANECQHVFFKVEEIATWRAVRKVGPDLALVVVR